MTGTQEELLSKWDELDEDRVKKKKKVWQESSCCNVIRLMEVDDNGWRQVGFILAFKAHSTAINSQTHAYSAG